MARRRGRGMASINYPIGMNLGGDPSQAIVHSNLTGKFTVSPSSIDFDQGMKSLTRRICAETLGVPVVGGAWMEISHALFETTELYYPNAKHGPREFVEYVMPGPGDICPHDIAVLARPAPDDPYRAKGPGEMCANPVVPAVANAIGVRVDDLPITAETVLRGLKAQGGARPKGKR